MSIDELTHLGEQLMIYRRLAMGQVVTDSPPFPPSPGAVNGILETRKDFSSLGSSPRDADPAGLKRGLSIL